MHGVYCFTDIHGMYELYKKIMDYCKGEDPEATIIFLGDAADRGPEGYRIMKELLENPHVVYLKGNHEDMFVKSARAIIGRYAANDDLYEYVHSLNKEQAQVLVKHMQDFDVRMHLENGGMQTLVDWLADGANEEFVDTIEHLPLTYKFENMDFCHAGGHPYTFEKVYNAEHDGKTNTLLPYDIYQTMWDRSALDLGWTAGRTCVFGHTPVVLMPAVVLMKVMGSRRGPIDDSTTLTSLPISEAPFTQAALPYSSAEQSCAKSPSLVLPPAERAVRDAVRNCPGFQLTCEAVKRMRRSLGSI